jgi:DNA repair ATPase RecN
MAAGRLDAAMAAELAPLKMERAVFATEITAGEPGPEGVDAVTFTVATNPGAPSGPLNRIASGGELSRFLLALKVCLTGESPGLTLIFDEIDRGVGGATADAVGRRLKALASGAQVLVVTHSPQVAAFGAQHWRVEKRVSGDQTLSTVTGWTQAARIEEIARMLSGDTVTEAARLRRGRCCKADCPWIRQQAGCLPIVTALRQDPCAQCITGFPHWACCAAVQHPRFHPKEMEKTDVHHVQVAVLRPFRPDRCGT